MTLPRVAWLYPSTGLLDGYLHVLAAARGAELFVFRVVPDPESELDVASLSEIDRLIEVAESAAGIHPDVVAWACTAGSFIGGTGHERDQRDALTAAAGCPATTTSHAIMRELEALGAAQVAVMTPYTVKVGSAFCEYLRSSGIDVVAEAHAGHATDEGISSMSTADILNAIPPDLAGADAIVLPCTGLRSEHAAQAIVGRWGLPVVTANAATLDHALRLHATEAAR